MQAWQGRGVRHVLSLGGVGRRDAVWLVLMSLMLFILLLPIASYVAALSFIKDEWGLNNTQAGVLFSGSLAGYALFALFVVPLTDRLGAKHILVGSAALSVVSHLLFPLFASDMVSAIILRAMGGMGFAGVYVPGSRIIAERFPGGGRGMALGLFVTAQYASNSASLAITGALMTAFEWRESYLALSLIAIAGLPVAYILLRAHKRRPTERSSGRLDFRVLKSPPVRYLTLGYSLHAMQLHAVRVWLPGFLLAILVAGGADTTQAVAKAATVAGLAMALGSAGPLMGGAISDRWGRAASASAIFALSGACSWAIGWIGGLPWALVVGIAVIYGWAISADSAIYTTGITEVASPARLGSTMAVQSSLGLIGGLAGPIAFGGILDLSPDAYQWGVAFSALGILSIVAIAALQRLRHIPQGRMLARGKG